MNNTLMVYLNKRLHDSDKKFSQEKTQPGPVICISREVGCGAVQIARILAAELDKHTPCRNWKVLSKEILEESARELDMSPIKLKNYLKEGERTLFDEIISAFSEKRYKSYRKISKTLIDLIFSFSNDGYCIIVGRGGHIIAREIEKSLFIKLVAPIDWRIKQIMEKDHLNMKAAIEFIERTEKERHNFVKHIGGERIKGSGFDLTLDLSRLNKDEIIDIIMFAAQTKGLLETSKNKMLVI